MTFTYDGTDLGKIIKNFSNNGTNFYLEYLDDSFSSYTCSDEKEIQRVIDLMIQQAKERDEHINLNELEFRKNCSLIATSIALTGVSLALNNNNQILFFILISLLMCVINDYRTTNKKIKELKKYKLFLELLPHLDEVNDSEILRSIEYDKIYQKYLDITTLDEHSYSQVKTIYKTYKEKVKKNI